jgi:linoleoyl-CoA desaturase
MSQGKLTFQPSSAFHAELRKRVDAYFDENHLSRAANGAMVAKTIFWLCFAWGTWALNLSQVVPYPYAYLVWAVQGFGFACIGFNIGHDAIHGSYSEKKWVNNLLSWSFDLMGASSYTWSIAHNTIHHTYTNIPGVDSDLEPGPTMVFYPQKTRFFHRFQHIYAWPLYALIGFIWVYIKDFEQVKRPDPLTGKGAKAKDYGTLILGKALHIGLLVVVPFIVIDAPLWQKVLGYTLFLGSAGVTLAVVFQLAHCVEGVVFPRAPTDANKMPEAWAEHQMRTTANFGKTPLATFICGGLEHQIEHHLMPRICHIHYPKLAPIVEKCAHDFGLPYVHNGSFFSAVGAHYRTLKKLGSGDTADLVEAAEHRLDGMTARAA